MITYVWKHQALYGIQDLPQLFTAPPPLFQQDPIDFFFRKMWVGNITTLKSCVSWCVDYVTRCISRKQQVCLPYYSYI
jgi:hypothetical protein